ncbi:TPA: hypothetical protein QIA86_001074 [Klebsiella pneumoniae]|nr:hypothetical protein [Klebsiella pneumoniae subsp. pneumoniae]HDT0256377.1 hypothetical protein [Klebsiella pneumoniae]
MTDITELAQSLKAEDISSERMEWLKKLADMEYCANNPGHWLMNLKETNYLASLALQCLESNSTLVEALEKAQTINVAAEKLVRCKGRYHSEQNYRALAALFGVKTPDLPPLDSESSAVTVKLTDINEYLAEVHDKTLNRAFRLLAEGVRAGDVAAMRAAGIKVEDECCSK